MEKAARIAELKCNAVDHSYKGLQEKDYMIDVCSNTDNIKEYSLLIDLLENEDFLDKGCRIKDIKY